MFSRKLFPNRLGDTKSLTCDFTPVTPSRNCVNTQLIYRLMWNKSTVFGASALKCLVSLFFFLRIRLNALILWNTGCSAFGIQAYVPPKLESFVCTRLFLRASVSEVSRVSLGPVLVVSQHFSTCPSTCLRDHGAILSFSNASVWPNFFRVNLLLIVHDDVFKDTGGDFLSFRQRTDPHLIIELLRGWVLFLLQEHGLCVEEEWAFFWQITNCQLNCEDVEFAKQSPLLCPAPAKEMIASKCSCR